MQSGSGTCSADGRGMSCTQVITRVGLAENTSPRPKPDGRQHRWKGTPWTNFQFAMTPSRLPAWKASFHILAWMKPKVSL